MGRSLGSPELSEQRVRDLIESASKTPAAPGSNAQKVGDFYASFMDQAAIDAKGLAPIKRANRRTSPRRDRAPTSPRLFGAPGYQLRPLTWVSRPT